MNVHGVYQQDHHEHYSYPREDYDPQNGGRNVTDPSSHYGWNGPQAANSEVEAFRKKLIAQVCVVCSGSYDDLLLYEHFVSLTGFLVQTPHAENESDFMQNLPNHDKMQPDTAKEAVKENVDSVIRTKAKEQHPDQVNTKQHSDAEAERPRKRKATSFCEADLKARDCIPSTKNPGLTKKSKDEGGNVDLNNLDTNQLVLWALFWRATSNSLQVENRELQQKQAVREESITQTWELDTEIQQLNQTVESSSGFVAEGAATIQEINKFESDSLTTHLTMDKIRPILCEFGFLSDAVSAVLQYELLDNPFLFSHISTSVQVHVCTLGNTWNHVRIPLC